MPGGPEGTWLAGLFAARRALYSGLVPSEARYFVADGVSGSAVGFGRTLAAATAAFEARVAASPPVPNTTLQTAWDDYDDDGNLLRRGEWPEPDWERLGESSDAPESWNPAPPFRKVNFTSGPITFTGPTPDVSLPAVSLANVPRVIVPLAGSPSVEAPVGGWERTVGAKGATAHVARLVRPGGFLQVGERVLWRVDPRTLDETLDAIDAERAGLEAMSEAASPYGRFRRFRSHVYRWAEDRAGRPAGLEWAGGGSGPHFDGRALDGDLEAVYVRRHVKIPRPK
jgi:hypothetical protein